MRLEVKQVSFSYGPSSPVLDNVSIKAEGGERIGLVGPSGCGKSTLAKILAGYLEPVAGEVLLDGKPLPEHGYCPVQLIYQHPEKALNPRRKLGDSLYEGWNPDQRLLDELGIKEEWLKRYPNELSGGELQRFCIARVLGPETKFLLADEISTMLDVITQAQLWQLMLHVVEERKLGLMLVTHNHVLAQKICTRIIDLERINNPH